MRERASRAAQVAPFDRRAPSWLAPPVECGDGAVDRVPRGHDVVREVAIDGDVGILCVHLCVVDACKAQQILNGHPGGLADMDECHVRLLPRKWAAASRRKLVWH